MSTQLVDNTNSTSQRLPDYYECVTVSHYDCTAAYWEDDEGNLHYTSMNCELSHVTSECTEGSGYSNSYNWSTYELPSNLNPGPAPSDPDKDDKDNPPLELCAEGYVRVLVDGEYTCISLADFWEQNGISLSNAFKNDPCAMAVYTKLTENNAAFNFIKAFTGENPTVNLNLNLSNSLPSNIAGRTETLNSNTIEVTLNQGLFSTYSQLSIIRALLHEFIHAELMYQSALNNPDFNDLFEEFANSQNGSTQHNIMINHYINPMASILQNIDANRMGDIENYRAISYTGLKDTDLWINTIAGTVDEDIINQLLAATYNGLESCK